MASQDLLSALGSVGVNEVIVAAYNLKAPPARFDALSPFMIEERTQVVDLARNHHSHLVPVWHLNSRPERREPEDGASYTMHGQFPNLFVHDNTRGSLEFRPPSHLEGYVIDITVYQHWIHFVKSGLAGWKDVPGHTKMSRRRDAVQRLIQTLRDQEPNLGGFRIEVRVNFSFVTAAQAHGFRFSDMHDKDEISNLLDITSLSRVIFDYANSIKAEWLEPSTIIDALEAQLGVMEGLGVFANVAHTDLRLRRWFMLLNCAGLRHPTWESRIRAVTMANVLHQHGAVPAAAPAAQAGPAPAAAHPWAVQPMQVAAPDAPDEPAEEDDNQHIVRNGVIVPDPPGLDPADRPAWEDLANNLCVYKMHNKWRLKKAVGGSPANGSWIRQREAFHHVWGTEKANWNLVYAKRRA